MSGAADPLGFVERTLAARGALCERSAKRLDVVLPAEVGQRLGIGEAASLAEEVGTGATLAGFGSELLERLLAEEVASMRVSEVRVAQPAARPLLAPERAFSLTNGVLESLSVEAGRALMLLFAFSWKVECDEIEQGLALASVAEGSRAIVPGYAALLSDDALVPGGVAAPERAEVLRLAAKAGAHARGEVLGRLDRFIGSVARRKRRDGERLRSYFAEARRELSSRRARAGGGAVEEKLMRLADDEQSKLAELEERYRVRLRLHPAALLLAEVPVQCARLRLRRRKGSREIVVRWHAAVRAWEPVVCEGCGTETRSFAACDDALHLLCGGCAGAHVTAGRISCKRCRGADEAGPGVPAVLELRAGLARPVARGPEVPTPAPVAAPSVPTAFESSTADAEEGASYGQLTLPFDPESAVRAQLDTGEARTALAIAAGAGLPVETVRPLLRRLIGRGEAASVGATRGTRYLRLPPGGKA